MTSRHRPLLAVSVAPPRSPCLAAPLHRHRLRSKPMGKLTKQVRTNNPTQSPCTTLCNLIRFLQHLGSCMLPRFNKGSWHCQGSWPVPNRRWASGTYSSAQGLREGSTAAAPAVVFLLGDGGNSSKSLFSAEVLPQVRPTGKPTLHWWKVAFAALSWRSTCHFIQILCMRFAVLHLSFPCLPLQLTLTNILAHNRCRIWPLDKSRFDDQKP